MSVVNELIDFVEERGGVATSSELKKAGFLPGEIAYAHRRGYIEKLTRGVYCSPDYLEDDYTAIVMRWRKCVLSHSTALYLLGLSDRVPFQLNVTVPHGYNPSGLSKEYPTIVIHRVNPEIYKVGLSQIESSNGVKLACYNAERCIADLIKERRQSRIDGQLVHDALTGYFQMPSRNLGELARICSALGVRRELQVYLEVFGS